MDKILQRLLDNDFAQAGSLTVNATIAMSESLATELNAIALQGNPKIEYCRVHIHRDNRVTLDVKSPLWPWLITVKLKLFGSVDLTGSPTVRAFLENHVLLGRLGSLLHALPSGIHLYEDQVAIHVESFLPLQEQRQFLELIKSIEIRTEEGRIFFDIKAGQ